MLFILLSASHNKTCLKYQFLPLYRSFRVKGNVFSRSFLFPFLLGKPVFVVMGVIVNAFRFEYHKHDRSEDNKSAAEPGCPGKYFIPEVPAEKNMEKDFTVHKERNDERIHMLESPGHKHLCRESKESQSDKPHPLNSFRHGETAFHKSRPYGDTENLEIENDFRI